MPGSTGDALDRAARALGYCSTPEGAADEWLLLPAQRGSVISTAFPATEWMRGGALRDIAAQTEGLSLD